MGKGKPFFFHKIERFIDFFVSKLNLMHTREQMTELLQKDKAPKTHLEKRLKPNLYYFVLTITALTFYLPLYCSFLITLTLYGSVFPYLEKKKKKVVANIWKGIKEQEHSLKN